MKLVETTEQGEIPLDIADLTRGGQLRIRQEALRFVDLRSPADRSAGEQGMVPLRGRLFVRGCVGILPLNEDYAVHVVPKAPASITDMLRAIGRTDAVVHVTNFRRGYETVREASDGMLDHLVDELISAIDGVAAQGLYRTYESRQEVSSHPRGRLMAEATMRLAARGTAHLAASEYFERTATNAPNQCLLAALLWAQRWNRQYEPAAAEDGTERAESLRSIRIAQQRKEQRGHRIDRLLHKFRHVEPDYGQYFLRNAQVQGRVPMPEHRNAYNLALPLAVALLLRRGFSLDAASGDLAFQSLLVDTEELFEKFIRARLAMHLSNSGLVVRNGNALREVIHLYSDAEAVDIPQRLRALSVSTVLKKPTAGIEPDVLIENAQGRALLVLDAKYKVVKTAASTDDVRQLITYAVNRDVKRVVSIHPREQANPESPNTRLFVTGRIGDIVVYQYRVALDAPDLGAETTTMSEVIAILASDFD